MSETTKAISGRVTLIDIETNAAISRIRIVDGPENGSLTVNPDLGSLAYVSTDPAFKGREEVSWEIDYADGTSERVDHVVDLETGPQRAGWGLGDELYMLRTDDDDEVIVETGDVHRKVYASGSDAALSKADIEAREGVAIPGDYGQWLAAHPEYGGSEGRALGMDGAQALWSEITDRGEGPTSHWLLFERGYDYDAGRLVSRGANGEDALHPIHITAWGEGAPPTVNSELLVYQDRSAHVVVSDLHLTQGGRLLSGGSMILEDVRFSGDGLVVQNFEGVTLRQSEILDVIRPEPTGGGDWRGLGDRVQGLFANKGEGLLVEQSLVDHTGWAAGYARNGDADRGQTPTVYSQNVYLQFDTTDVTFRDNVSMRAASFGAQIRGGGMVEDNLFLDNNAGFSTLGGRGVAAGVNAGTYSLSNGNLVTSGAHKVGITNGALTLGIDDQGEMSALTSNIVAHLANPDDPAEFERKLWEHAGNKPNAAQVFDDTIVHNWEGSRYGHDGSKEANTDGLDAGRLAVTTIQRYAADLLGRDGATIDDLGTHWSKLTAAGGEVDLDHLLDFFRGGFGLETGTRSAAGTVTFVADPRGDGVRWDNRLNWDSGDLAGTVAGDSVDLNGSYVQYGGSHDIADLDFGDGGSLAVSHGYLGVERIVGGGTLDISRAGQVWIAGTDGDGLLDVDVSGGRFVNVGTLAGSFDIAASAGETVLATEKGSMTVSSGTISVTGDAKAGFDGASGGVAALRLTDGATLRLSAEGGALGRIREFRTGAFDDTDVTSLVDLSGARLEVDLGGLKGLGSHALIAADVLSGGPSDVAFSALGARDAIVRIDHVADTVRVELVEGSGETRLDVTDQDAAEAAREAGLWSEVAAAPDAVPAEGEVPDPGPIAPGTPEPGPADPETPGPETPGPEAETPQPVDENAGPEVETPQPGIGADLSALHDDPQDRLDVSMLVPRVGTNGSDVMVGDAAGNDLLDGAAGNDRLVGRSGDDWIEGGAGRDVLFGSVGNDVMFGGTGDDRVVGQNGDDHLEGGAGQDRISGGGGRDVLLGDAGDDDLDGAGGDDTLVGGAGDDRLYGGGGADQFVLTIPDGQQARGAVMDFDQGQDDRLVIAGADDGLSLVTSADGGSLLIRVERDGDMLEIGRLHDAGTLELETLYRGDDLLILG